MQAKIDAYIAEHGGQDAADDAKNAAAAPPAAATPGKAAVKP